MSLVRAPAAMAPLALVLAGRAATGSFAFGGVLAAAHAIAEAVAAAPAGRLIDRMRARGPGAARVASIVLLALAAAAFGATAAAVAAGAPEAALVALVVAGGAAAGGVPSALRADLPGLVPESQLQRALAVDAALLEAVWVAAPAAVAGLAALVSPAAAVAAMAVVAGVAAVTVPPAASRPMAVPARRRGVRMLNRPTVTLLVTTAAMGYAEGSIGVALPPMLDELGHEPELAGVLLAALSASAVAGGLLYGRLHGRWRLDSHRRAEVLLAILALGVLALSRAESLVGMAAAVALVGLVVAPLNATRSYAMEHSAPAGREAEAFSLMYASMGGGWGLSGLGLGVLLGSLGAGGALAVAGALALVVALAALVVETGARSQPRGAGARTG